MKKYIFIDIRKSDEAYMKHFDGNKHTNFYNIPMNMIRFNKQNIINHLQYVDGIYIICQSGKRSQFIKNKYFSDNDNIKVSKTLQFNNLKIGKNQIVLNNQPITIHIDGSGSFNLYNDMRIIQIILGLLILSAGGYTYFHIRNGKINTIPLIILLIMGMNSLYNGLTSTCTMSSILINYLN
jgi:rhodanese-related sulfurtransferase